MCSTERSLSWGEERSFKKYRLYCAKGKVSAWSEDPEIALWKGDGRLQRQIGIPIFTDGSKFDEGTCAGVFSEDLSFKLHFRLKDDY